MSRLTVWKNVISCADGWLPGCRPLEGHVSRIGSIMGHRPEFVYVTVNLVTGSGREEAGIFLMGRTAETVIGGPSQPACMLTLRSVHSSSFATCWNVRSPWWSYRGPKPPADGIFFFAHGGMSYRDALVNIFSPQHTSKPAKYWYFASLR